MLSGYIYLLEVIEPKSSFFGFKYIGQHFETIKNDGYFTGGKIVKAIETYYGRKAFKKIILVANINNIKLLDELEIHYIQLYNTYKYTSKNGLNLTLGGKSSKGRKFTKETRKKMSIANLGKTLSSEHKQKISNTLRGRKLSLKTIEKLKIFHVGRKTSEATKLKISEAHKKRGTKPPSRKGVIVSEESKQRMRHPKSKKNKLTINN